ncbi:hypothetical protein GC089_01370 [Cellulomonas sp. JZ18]|uniref:hypothetical protein n=1 Tax=Cellulomonas sp. JZ18 TaxID=2654191 RepID=UPI0012D43B67|nr:hypothetical protein [Cellulomonas sp. JZ18]QGQ18165.1 hypothetical protein GC089_01370 [Cellulomonas sp. JZ18]
MRRWTGAVLTTTAALVGAIALAPVTAPPATAAPPGVAVTTCTGTAGPVVAAGDVVLDGTCSVPYVDVGGDLWVQPGASVEVRGLAPSVLGEDVLVGSGAQLVLDRADVAGRVWLDGARQLALQGSTVGRSVRGTSRHVYAYLSHVHGALNVASRRGELVGGLSLHASTVGGWVNTYGGNVSVAGAHLGRGLTVSWAETVVVCSTRVAADATVRHARYWVTLTGVDEENHSECGHDPSPVPDQTVVGGSLRLLDNRATEHPTLGIAVTRTAVAGDLECRGNGAVPALTDVTVQGHRLGQCT